MMLFFFTLIANVDVRTTIPFIDVQSAGTRAGIITFSVNGDDYQAASPENPIYERIRFDQGTKLAETLVDLEHATIDSEPINLVMNVEGDEGAKIHAPADTVRIVRWRKGESEFWLEVRHPSSAWIEKDGEFISPNTGVRVTWTMGRAVEEDQVLFSSAYENGRANLPANLRGDQPQHTFFMLDTRSSILQAWPALNSEQDLDQIAFIGSMHVRTAASPTSIIRGNQVSASFGCNCSIGRGEFRQPIDILPFPAVSMELGLETYNPWPESRPVVVETLDGDGLTSKVTIHIASPGLSQLRLDENTELGVPDTLLVREAEHLDIKAFARNRSGHRFHFTPSLLATHGRFPLASTDDAETWFLAYNPNQEVILVNLFLTDQSGQESWAETLSLSANALTRFHLNPYIEQNAIQNLDVRSDQPIDMSVTQQFERDEQQGWIRSVPGHLMD